MKVKELIEKLNILNPNAEVMVIAETGEDNGYQTVFDCEEEFADLVTIGCGYPVITKDILIKALEENNTDVLNRVRGEDIGQGIGYKSKKEWSRMLANEVIYIPECGYRQEDENGNEIITDHFVNKDCIYTKQDFIDIVKDKVKPSRVDDEAFALFDMVDWQCAEVLVDELNYDEDFEEPSDKAFDPKINCRGCKSKCVDKKTGKPACEEVDDLCENITWCPKTCGKY